MDKVKDFINKLYYKNGLKNKCKKLQNIRNKEKRIKKTW